MSLAYLGLGTNLGDKEANICTAIEEINRKVGRVIFQSASYETAPWGFESENTFLHAAVCVETLLQPLELLEVVQHIERDMGRTTKTVNQVYSDRIIDIDILLYDKVELHHERLTLPHPHMHTRDFVMKPLREIWDKEEKEEQE